MSVKISVVVTCYNYVAFVGDCLASVLAQTTLPFEIIVVDDGSTDGSSQAIEPFAARFPALRLLTVPNGGQLRAFQIGLENSTGDIIAFLDADDMWMPGYIERLTHVYRTQPNLSVLFSNAKLNGEKLMSNDQRFLEHGVNALSTAFAHRYLGMPTSCISARRRFVEKALLIPAGDVAEWRLRADDCLVLGTAIHGAVAASLGQPFVHYRVHGANGWFGRAESPVESIRYELKLERLRHHYRNAAGLDYQSPNIARLARLELMSKPNASFGDLSTYAKLVWLSRATTRHKLSILSKMARHTFKGQGQGHSVGVDQRLVTRD